MSWFKGMYPTIIIVLVCLKLTWEDSPSSTTWSISAVRYARRTVSSQVSDDTYALDHTSSSRTLGIEGEADIGTSYVRSTGPHTVPEKDDPSKILRSGNREHGPLASQV